MLPRKEASATNPASDAKESKSAMTTQDILQGLDPDLYNNPPAKPFLKRCLTISYRDTNGALRQVYDERYLTAAEIEAQRMAVAASRQQESAQKEESSVSSSAEKTSGAPKPF